MDASLMQAVADAGGAAARPPHWLSARSAAVQAADIVFDAAPRWQRPQWEEFFGTRPIDFALQPLEGRAKKLLCIDMESTLIEQEWLDEMAAHLGIKEKVAALTARAMRGELDFSAALRARLALMQGFPQSELEAMRKRTRFHDGAERLVQRMQAAGAECCLVTGGFRFFADAVPARLPGFHAVLCNDWELADGRLSGALAGPLVDGDAKAAFLRARLAALKLEPAASLAVGDGANDVAMLTAAGFGVAYRGKPPAEAAADAVIRHTDLASLLYMQGYADEA